MLNINKIWRCWPLLAMLICVACSDTDNEPTTQGKLKDKRDHFSADDPRPHIEIDVDQLFIDSQPIAMIPEIGHWVKVLGPYDRFDKGACMFTWDQAGYVVVLGPINGKTTEETTPSDCGKDVQLKMVYSNEGVEETYSEYVDLPNGKGTTVPKLHPFPRGTFKGTLIVNGLKVYQGMDKWLFQDTPWGPSFWVGEGNSVASDPQYEFNLPAQPLTCFTLHYDLGTRFSDVVFEYVHIYDDGDTIMEEDLVRMRRGEKVDKDEAKRRFQEAKRTGKINPPPHPKWEHTEPLISPAGNTN